MQVDPSFVESLLFQEAIKYMDASPLSEAIQLIPVLDLCKLRSMLYDKQTSYVWMSYSTIRNEDLAVETIT